jgi:hypothetical protein
MGHGENFAPIRVAGPSPAGRIVATQIVAMEGDTLIGEAA